MPTFLNRGTQTTYQALQLVVVETGERMEIQFVPENLVLERSPDVSAVKIIGRNVPKYQYTGGETTLSMRLDFYAEEQNRVTVARRCRWLEALTHNDAGTAPAKRVTLMFGQLYKDDLWVVKSVRTEYSNFSRPHGFLPQQAYVDIVLAHAPNSNTSWSTVNPDMAEGTPDGQNKISLGPRRQTDDDDSWRDLRVDNSFGAMMARLRNNLRLGQYTIKESSVRSRIPG